MSFETHIADHLKELEAKGKQLYWDRDKLTHSCDCEYCEYDDIDDENQPEWDRLTAEITELSANVKKINDYAEFYKTKRKV